MTKEKMRSLRLRSLELLGLIWLAWLIGAPPRPPTHAQTMPPIPHIEPALLRALAAPGNLPLRIIVTLHPQPDVDSLHTAIAASQPFQARQLLVDGLQAQLAQARAPLKTLLTEASATGALLSERELWIINGLALRARPTLIHALAKSPTVATLRLDSAEPYIELQASGASALDGEVTWGVEAIRAPEVWSTLGISGTGAVVAGMDSGVDWQHPALLPNYRGNLGHGRFDHSSAWFDVVNGGVYPYDDHGHGTHTLGTAVGQEGIGVAPEARWIAVKILNNQGYAYDADIHAGFQWLLAPGGDPALAPDIVNCSWGATLSTKTEFQPDLEALIAAGILPLFAAGNEGPSGNSLRSPASLPGIFAVGASDPYGNVASFSSRGPSPWGEIKPYIVAPGVQTWSTMPGGVYASSQGTSMATPHVAGVAALMRSISPTLPVATLTQILTTTAVPLTTTVPNNDSGWGQVDAYAALIAISHPGFLEGEIQDAQGAPLSGVTLQAHPHGAGNAAHATTGADGRYRLALTPGTYDLTAARFGYVTADQPGVVIRADTTTPAHFTLTAYPTGALRGQVTVQPNGVPPTHTVTLHVRNTPITTTLDAAGHYALELPAGTYTLEARGLGYRVAQAAQAVQVGQTTWLDFALDPAPTLLLVDEGVWYYGSQLPYWEKTLDALDYVYDTLLLHEPPPREATTAHFAAYDLVLWSSPGGSPGIIGAGTVISDYLGLGGRLLLSGQDVAYFDGGGGFMSPVQYYLDKQLGIYHLTDNAPTRALTGAGPFSGLTIDIAGGDGADNQLLPDEIVINDHDKAEPVWQYAASNTGGAATHICTPYRSLFFAFGFEAIADRVDREAVMARSIDWLMEPPSTAGLAVSKQTPAPQTIGLPGEPVTHVVRIRHVGMAGPTDALTLTLSGGRWPTTITPTHLTLEPCTAHTFTATVNIPLTATVNTTDRVTLAVQSALLPTSAQVTLTTKTPAPVLLMDDDRWYPMESYYRAALETADIPYDVWDTAHNQGGLVGASSIPTTTLDAYPIVVWFTGYDWYAPILELEETRLLHYLDQGGRLLLSSQDFLYYQTGRVLAPRMGVQTWHAEGGITEVQGVPGHPAGGQWGPVTLTYPYPNWSDVVEPAPTATVVLRSGAYQPLAIGAEGDVASPWRTLFYAFPLETLPAAFQARALADGVGWLSPLGNSTWEINPATPSPGATMTATLVLHNDGKDTQAVALRHQVPPALTVKTTSLPPALTYHALNRQLTWSGESTPGEPLTLTWQASLAPDVAPGTHLTPTVALTLTAWQLPLQRTAHLRVAGAELGASRWLSPAHTPLTVQRPTTLTFALQNTGAETSTATDVDLWLMQGLAPLTATVPPTQGHTLHLWQGALAAGDVTTLTIPLRAWSAAPLRIDALLRDATGFRWERNLWLNVVPQNTYLPLILRDGA